MYRKVAYVFSAVTVGSVVGYGIKTQHLKDNANIHDVHEQTEHFEKPFSPSHHFTGSAVFENQEPNKPIAQAILKARDLAYRLKDEVGAPGLVIGVSINGRSVWKEGLGMADVENRVPCHPDTVMRIASISKSMTMAVVAKLWQDGKLDLDKPVQQYVPSFPKKKFKNEEVTITTRQLVSHLAGIRHYKKKKETDKSEETADTEQEKSKKTSNIQSDTVFEEFFIKDRYNTVIDALKLFQEDDLLFKPGTSFEYTTHGWTLVSGVVEAAAKESFPKLMKDFFNVMGLKNTYLDEAEPLIYNRSRYYSKTPKGRLKNVPYVDNSYKWAGGGFLSTVGDLLQFGNAMLYSFQWTSELESKLYPPGYLNADTVNKMWTVLPGTTMKWGRGDGYGMGWVVVPSLQEHGGGDVQKFAVGHTGGAVGASSVLLVVPTSVSYTCDTELPETLSGIGSDPIIPSGVTVAIIVNLEDVGLHRLALQVANLFCETLKSTS